MKKSVFSLFLCLVMLLCSLSVSGVLSVSAEAVTAVALTEADAATADAVTDANILTSATFGTAAKADANKLSAALLYDGVVGGVHGVNSGSNPIVTTLGAGSTADDDSDYVYITFPLGDTYTLEQFLLAFTGDSSSNDRYGIRGLDVWVGDKTAAQVIADGDAPLYSDTVVRASKPVLLTFNDAPKGRYLVIRMATSWTGGTAAIWLSEIAATGKKYEPVVAADLTEADVDAAKAVTDNNILKNSVAAFGTAATVDSNKLNTSLLYDGVVGGIHGVHSSSNSIVTTLGAGSTADEDSKYLYFTFDFGSQTILEQFLLAFSGDSSSSERFGIRELYVWVGNETAAQVIANGTAPLYGKDYGLRAVKPVLLTFNEQPMGRYLVLKIRTSWTGGTAAIWLSEIAAVGKKYEPIVASDLTEADADAAKAVTDNNILKNSVATFGTAAAVDTNKLNTTRLYDGIVGGIHGVDGNPDPLTTALGGGSTANEDSKYLYFTFDLGANYTLDQFLLAFSGDSSSNERYGIRELYVWVGGDTAAQVIAEGTEPLYSADYGLRAVKPVLLTFNEEPLGRYLVLKIRTSWTGGNAVIWLSEIAATGTKAVTPDAPLVGLGSQLRDVSVSTNYALRFAFSLACDGIDYAEPDSDTNFARAPLTADSKVMLNGKACTVTDFGTLVSLENGDDFTLENVGDTVKCVPSDNLYDVDEETVTYTAVVTGIPAAHKDTVIYARPYIVTEEWGVLYGDVMADSVFAVLEDVVN